MKVAFFWEESGLSLDRANPYGGLLARAMANYGVELIPGFAGQLTDSWLDENRNQVQVLHLNWPHFLYQAADLPERISRCADLISRLARARLLGYKVIWTMHNLYPHESPSHDLDRLARLAITQVATAVIAHCNYARGLLKQHFFRDMGVFVIPHGHFVDPYPNTVSRSEARSRLGVPEDKFVYLFFGNVRPNKGVETLLEAFSKISDEDAILLFAAKVYSDYGVSLTDRAAKDSSRIIVHVSRFFANDEFQFYLNAADVVVLPFVDILTSGSAITALSFNRPVIVPAIGCLPELVDSTVGFLYDPEKPEALVDAMKAIRATKLDSYSDSIRLRLESLSWDSIARQTLQAYQHEP